LWETAVKDLDVTPGPTPGDLTSVAEARLAFVNSRLRRERRRAGRLAAARLLACHFESDGQFAPALRVIDVSPRGIGLLLPVPLLRGERLRLLLGRRDSPLSTTAEWRVAHTHAAGGNFVVGGPFAEPLSPAAYRLLLG
jgi:hypothetical protein